MGKGKTPDWSELPPELLELFIFKLPSIDLPRFSVVCSSWHAASKPHLQRRYPPLLMLPPKVTPPPQFSPLLRLSSTINFEDEDVDDLEYEFEEEIGERLRFLSLDDMKIIPYTPLMKKKEQLVAWEQPGYAGSGDAPGRLLYMDCCVVGSSHGFVLFLDQNAELLVLNPFSGAKIELPKKTTLPHNPHERSAIYQTDPRSGVECENYTPVVERAILTANPSVCSDYMVVIIYGSKSRLAFCCYGDINWTNLSDSQNYVDLACYNKTLYALQNPNDVHDMGIHTWDLSVMGHPRKISHIVIPSFTWELEDLGQRFFFAKCIVLPYVVPSSEEIFLVARIVGRWDATNGTVIGLEDNLLSYGSVCPYITLGFQVYKVDLDVDSNDQRKLVKVESLEGRAMFLGQNHSTMISFGEHELGLNGNSIYYTDDNWGGIIEHHSYGGHDIGIYSFADKSLSLVCDVQKYKFAPFWVFPGWK